MSAVLVVLLVLHGLIHLMGFLKAFGFAALPQLALPISRPLGVLWLVAAVAMLATGALVYLSPRWWWAVGAAAVVLSQVVIVASWGDAKFGTLANVVVLVAAILGFFSAGPTSLRAEYEREVGRGLARSAPAAPVTEQDLAPLPLQVQRYLRLAGVVGQPRVRSYHIRFTGRIRGGPTAAWMPFVADQYSFADQPTRLFFMRAKMFGLPVDALHMYFGEQASMRVKVLSMVPMVNIAGSALAASETVTLFNDMCLMAPATLVDPKIRWEPVDAQRVKATFTNAGTTIQATLVFDDAGQLVDFVSDDRSALQPDNVTFVKQRWSTPVSKYKSFGPFRLMSFGEARYHPSTGEYAYGEFELQEVAYNPTAMEPLD